MGSYSHSPDCRWVCCMLFKVIYSVWSLVAAHLGLSTIYQGSIFHPRHICGNFRYKSYFMYNLTPGRNYEIQVKYQNYNCVNYYYFTFWVKQSQLTQLEPCDFRWISWHKSNFYLRLSHPGEHFEIFSHWLIS
jgi:hypothetical protein